jgi:hypothetical protein
MGALCWFGGRVTRCQISLLGFFKTLRVVTLSFKYGTSPFAIAIQGCPSLKGSEY